MKGRRGTVGMMLAVAALGCAAAVAGGGVWVSSDGETHGTLEGGKVVLVGGGEGFDLSQLADGETRVFGAGDHSVTATRRGDVATITRAASDDGQAVDVTCELGRDKCRIVTTASAPERVMIVVQKERTCVDGEGDCAEVSVDAADAMPGDGQRIEIRKVLRCEDPDHCEESEDLSGDPMMFISPLAGMDHPDVHEFILAMPHGDSVLLRCPEGDATLRVKKDEAEQVYLCPKHSKPMQKAEPRSGVKQRQESSQPRSF
jgi:hypothetical protein